MNFLGLLDFCRNFFVVEFFDIFLDFLDFLDFFKCTWATTEHQK